MSQPHHPGSRQEPRFIALFLAPPSLGGSFPDDAVIRLVRMADPILRLITPWGRRATIAYPPFQGPRGSVLGITDLLAGGIAMLIHQTSSFIECECGHNELHVGCTW